MRKVGLLVSQLDAMWLIKSFAVCSAALELTCARYLSLPPAHSLLLYVDMGVKAGVAAWARWLSHCPPAGIIATGRRPLSDVCRGRPAWVLAGLIGALHRPG